MNWMQWLESEAAREQMASLYGCEAVEIDRAQRRYRRIAEKFQQNFGEEKMLRFYSAPGRMEIGGNHTDHQHGCVLAAAVNLDIVAAAAKRDDGRIRFCSEEFEQMDVVDTSDSALHREESGSSAALLRGVCARMKELGYRIGGFDAYSASLVPMGCGLSSSAAFEVLVVTILSHLYNDGCVDAQSAAQIAQYAENEYFGKPCGLMDQMTCSVGGLVAMDFLDPNRPVVESLSFHPQDLGYTLCIVNTGGSHADLTEEYASIADEMKAVAKMLGHKVLRECSEDGFYTQIKQLRGEMGDRAVLRAIHFFNENRRAIQEKEALQRGDFEAFRRLAILSGQSSFEYLQNVFSVSQPRQQGIALALSLSQRLLQEKGGVWRIHGGGFAGTIQAFVPQNEWNLYQEQLEAVFGAGACHLVTIRGQGGVRVC